MSSLLFDTITLIKKIAVTLLQNELFTTKEVEKVCFFKCIQHFIVTRGHPSEY